MVTKTSPIAAFREAQGLSMEALAYAAGVSVATVYRAEHRRHQPSSQTLKALAAALKVDVAELLHDADSATPPDGRGELAEAASA